VINIGNIKTQSLELKVKYAGLDSMLFDDLCKLNHIRSHSSANLVESSSSKVQEPSVFSGQNCSVVDPIVLAEEIGRLAVHTPFTTQNDNNGYLEGSNVQKVKDFM
jgi:hypothetical protein